jgi:hypothetical protein
LESRLNRHVCKEIATSELSVGFTTPSLDTPISVSCNRERVSDPSMHDFQAKPCLVDPMTLTLPFLSKNVDSMRVFVYIRICHTNMHEQIKKGGQICTVT